MHSQDAQISKNLVRKYERNVENFAQFLWSWLLTMWRLHSLIKIKINQNSRIGFIQIPKDEILISLKKKLNQTRLTKTKDIQRLDGQERKDPLDNCPTFKARS